MVINYISACAYQVSGKELITCIYICTTDAVARNSGKLEGSAKIIIEQASHVHLMYT